MDAQKIKSADIRQFVGELILADRMMQRQGLVWGERYEELSQPIRAARKALDEALEANEQTLASKEAELVRLSAVIREFVEANDAHAKYRASDGREVNVTNRDRYYAAFAAVRLAGTTQHPAAITQPPKEPT